MKRPLLLVIVASAITILLSLVPKADPAAWLSLLPSSGDYPAAGSSYEGGASLGQDAQPGCSMPGPGGTSSPSSPPGDGDSLNGKTLNAGDPGGVSPALTTPPGGVPAAEDCPKVANGNGSPAPPAPASPASPNSEPNAPKSPRPAGPGSPVGGGHQEDTSPPIIAGVPPAKPASPGKGEGKDLLTYFGGSTFDGSWGGEHRNSNSYVGYNWFNNVQTELVKAQVEPDSTQSAAPLPYDDLIYLVTGPGTYATFKAISGLNEVYRGVNGTVGVVKRVFGESVYDPDLFEVYDTYGNVITYFADNAACGGAKMQWWKTTDGAGNMSYAGDPSDPSQAIGSGYAFIADGTGGLNTRPAIKVTYDATGVRTTYSYSLFSPLEWLDIGARLVHIEMEKESAGQWHSVGSVDFTYVQSGQSNLGDVGDLATVTTTTPLSEAGQESSQTYHYRYHGLSHPHMIKSVITPEGYRRWSRDTAGTGWAIESMSAAQVASYVSLEYDYDAEERVSSATVHSGCACGGNAVHTYRYEENSVYLSSNNKYVYDQVWRRRTVQQRPNGSWVTQYYDEQGQVLGHVYTDLDPNVSTSGYRAIDVVRDDHGDVVAIHSTENVEDYVHNAFFDDLAGTFKHSDSVGIVEVFEREYAAPAVEDHSTDGFIKSIARKIGASGTPEQLARYQYNAEVVFIGGAQLTKVYAAQVEEFTEAGQLAGDVTTFAQTFHSGTTLTESLTVTLPVVDQTENGSGLAESQSYHFGPDGRLDLVRDADGVMGFYGYSGGLMTTRILDADTTALFGTGNEPAGFITSGNPLSLATTLDYDEQRRLKSVTQPSGRKDEIHYSKLGDGRRVALRYALVEPGLWYGPVSMVVSNLSGLPEAVGVIGPTGGLTTVPPALHVDETSTNLTTAFSSLGTLDSIQTISYGTDGNVPHETRAYHSIPTGSTPGVDQWPGVEGVHYDANKYQWDESGNLLRVEDPTGTIDAFTYDLFGNPLTVTTGTDDSSTGDMTLVEDYEYDNGQSGGPLRLTRKREFSGPQNQQVEAVTSFTYAPDGDLVLINNPEAPHFFFAHDLKGRVTASGLYSDLNAATALVSDPVGLPANRVGLSEAFFDPLGRVWKSIEHNVDQGTTTSGGAGSVSGAYSLAESLVSQAWFDKVGRVAKVKGNNYSKSKYDRLGRVTARFLLGADDDTGYTDYLDVAGDTVVEQVQWAYENEDLRLATQISRHHDDGVGQTLGSLDLDSDGDPLTLASQDVLGWSQTVGYRLDPLGRVGAHVAVGTKLDWGVTDIAQAVGGADILITAYSYADSGRVQSVIDPTGKVSRRHYDALGRVTDTYGNWKGGASQQLDEDQRTSFVYQDGLLASLTAHNAEIVGSQYVLKPQTTNYSYGVQKGYGVNEISSGRLLSKVTYPDSVGTDDSVKFAFDRQGRTIWRQDQAGNVLQRIVDGLGRTTAFNATSIVPGFDSTVESIGRAYGNLGGLARVTQYADTGQLNVVNEVEFERYGHGAISLMRQDVDSEIDAANSVPTYDLSYTYNLATSGRQAFRRTGETLPSGRTVSFVYGTGINNSLSRVALVKDGARRLASYSYLGSSRVVGTDYAIPSVYSNLFDPSQSGYPGLDAFGRVARTRWTKDYGSGTTDFFDSSVKWDENSNPILITDGVIPGRDVEYGLDGLDRLESANEGTWDDTIGNLTNMTRSQAWDLDLLGNWDVFTSDLNADGALNGPGELDEHRQSNDANEIETRDLDGDGSVDETLVYDEVGNLVETPQHRYVYDVWGRQVATWTKPAPTSPPAAQALLVEYMFNGLGYRVGEHSDVDASGAVDSADPWYWSVYDQRWRAVATYRGSDAEPKEEFVYHAAGMDGFGSASYINNAILRYKDANTPWTDQSDGVLEHQHFHCVNHRGDVVSVVDGSGGTVEWARYSSYGVPFGYPIGDCNSDGTTDAADLAIMQALEQPGALYDVRADVNLDGAVTAADETRVLRFMAYSPTGGDGILSSFGNRFGYGGMALDSDGAYDARNRRYMPSLGIWLKRDPLGYADGPNQLLYVSGQPVRSLDPLGLQGVVMQPQRARQPDSFLLDGSGGGGGSGNVISPWAAAAALLHAWKGGARIISDPAPDVGPYLPDPDSPGQVAAPKPGLLAPLSPAEVRRLLTSLPCASGPSPGDAGFIGPVQPKVKKALKKVYEKVGGPLPRGEPGKYGSPQWGTPEKGYRLDPGHPNREQNDPESGPHYNWWDYTEGKRGKGGDSGAVPIGGY